VVLAVVDNHNNKTLALRNCSRKAENIVVDSVEGSNIVVERDNTVGVVVILPYYYHYYYDSFSHALPRLVDY